jgi:hypothetical protein
MGLSIHYKGNFKPHASLEEMIHELEDIAKIHKWKYHIFEKQFPEKVFTEDTHDGKLYGMLFSPPECEPVCICFLSNGKMSGPVQLQFYGDSKNKTEEEYLYWISVKTQFAGSQIHKLVIHLLKYVSKKYLSEFSLNDEGQYWETGDEKLLDETFGRYNFLLDAAMNAFENFPLMEKETMESYFERVLGKINTHRKEEK